MNSRPNLDYFPACRGLPPFSNRGYTLVEILVALALSLILMTAVVQVFAGVGNGITKARRALEQFDRLRTAAQQLNMDLSGVTARLDGRAGRPEEALGYAEFGEGSYLFATGGTSGTYYGIKTVTGAAQPQPDYLVGERGDILMFTARNAARPFVGRYQGATVQSDVAEVCWFLRGNRLHRRVLLVVPGAAQALYNYNGNFYNDNDISVRRVNGKFVPNSLADLVKRENRFGHNALLFPFDVRGWGTYGLPTLAECTSPSYMSGWTAGSTPPPLAGPITPVDMWDNSPNDPSSAAAILPDQALNASKQDGQRVSDDVVLTNVIGFDVKVWEPGANNGAGGYVDLGSNEVGTQGGPVTLVPGKPNSFQPPLGPTSHRFNNGGIYESGLSGSGTTPRVYDSGCFGYANEAGLGGGKATNGLSDDGSGIVDDMGDYIIPTGPLAGLAPGVLPYPVPLRGIQVKIRCFEPDSRQTREITIEHDFLPK